VLGVLLLVLVLHPLTFPLLEVVEFDDAVLVIPVGMLHIYCLRL
jgi:hypothetical protein